MNPMLEGSKLCIFWVRIPKLEFWRRDDNGLYNLYCHPQGSSGICALTTPARLVCCLPPGSLCWLKGHMFLDVWLCITQLFVCFCLPYKQFSLLLGKRNNMSRANTHMLSKILCSSVQQSQIFLGHENLKEEDPRFPLSFISH